MLKAIHDAAQAAMWTAQPRYVRLRVSGKPESTSDERNAILRIEPLAAALLVSENPSLQFIKAGTAFEAAAAVAKMLGTPPMQVWRSPSGGYFYAHASIDLALHYCVAVNVMEGSAQ